MAEYLPFIFFAAVFLALVSGYPVAFVLGGVSLIFGYFTVGLDFFNLLPLRIWGIMSNYVLVAVPLFIYMGVMLEKSGIGQELLETSGRLFGRLRGGLAVSVILVGAMLAAATGIVGATVITMGVLSLPIMIKKGYSKELAAGTVLAAGTLGQIIPPSIILILLGSIFNVSVGDLFLGAVIPGTVLVFLYILLIVLFSFLKPNSVPRPLIKGDTDETLDEYNGFEFFKKIAGSVVTPLLLIFIVLGSIFFGLASPTEAAGVGAMGALLLTFVKGRLSIDKLKAVMKDTTFYTSMVFMILVGAACFSLTFRGMGGDRMLKDLVLSAGLGSNGFLLVVMCVVFIAGFFLDVIEIIFIIVPIIAPIFSHFGIDPVWVCVLIAVNLQTSFITPPVGFSLFFLKGVSPEGVTTSHIYRGVVPFVFAQLAGLTIFIVFPQTITWLPAYFN